MSQILYQFSGERFSPIEWCDPARQTTLVADSFRVEAGRVVALERHLERFSDSVLSNTDITPDRLNAFLSALVSTIPAEGSWFPRIEAVETPGGATLRYRERPAPPWSSEVVVARAPHDPRRFPHTKGPDLEALLALRTQVAPLGANEAIITTNDDLLVEGAYSSLLVWLPGEDNPLAIPPSTPHLPGVTERVVTDIAQDLGVQFNHRDLRVADLEGAELWILSALHGIRVATNFVEGPLLDWKPGRRDHWHSLWWSHARAPAASTTE
jgi:branched-subunit amino acid aminotransferase/4-amino-4-deoxychorismate lyase